MRIPHLFAALALATVSVSASAVVPTYPNPGYQNPVNYSFKASSSGDVIAYFMGTTAAFDSEIGLLVNGVDTGVYGLPNHATSLGTALNFGPVHAGDTLVFVLHVSSIGARFYSETAYNADQTNHIYSVNYGGGDFGVPAGTFVAFEDLPGGGDFNYNDHKFVFTNVQQIGNALPEPAAWTLLISGFGLAGVALRRRAMGKATVQG